MAHPFDAILERFPGQRMLVIGDVVLDRYWWGECTRISPEAPVPVVRKVRATITPGGAANTAANLAALGAAVDLVGITGADAAAAELRAALSARGVAAAGLLAVPGRPTTTKTRIVALHQHIARVDDEETSPVGDPYSAAALELTAARLAGAAAVVVSDYAKGFLTPAFLERLIRMARSAGKPVFVDPKGMDWTRYAGCTLIKPNRAELTLLTGMPAEDHAETLAAGRRLAEYMGGTLVLVTEGKEGLTLFDGSREEHLAPVPRQVYDVTGAGDTVLAAISLALCSGASHAQAMHLAGVAASIVIGLAGTATVTREDLAAAVSGVPPLYPAAIPAAP